MSYSEDNYDKGELIDGEMYCAKTKKLVKKYTRAEYEAFSN